MYIYKVRKIWYDDFDTIESETPLTDFEIRKRIDEQRLYCDEIDIEETTDICEAEEFEEDEFEEWIKK